MKNISDTKNIQDGINSILGTTEDKISEPEDVTIIKNTQNEEKEKKSTASVTRGTISSDLTSVTGVRRHSGGRPRDRTII